MHNPQGKRSADITRPRFFKREVDTQMTGHNWEKRDTVTEKPKREVDTRSTAQKDTVMARPKRHGGGGDRGKRDVMADRGKENVKRETENASTLPKTQGKRDIYHDDRRVKRDEATTLSPEPTTVAGRKKRETGTQNQFSGQKTVSPIQG
ncbi:hypothetical protein WR25_08086 [Diploscapter pachys]|uniref:Uncharacterized protein n=1 Tax=Diploscapter pachys TaxID=2018661 RepID=A0A2A2L1P4_9BILA|nr:hypothetical protein WR25_08086 [Diploscapter pachys]